MIESIFMEQILVMNQFVIILLQPTKTHKIIQMYFLTSHVTTKNTCGWSYKLSI